MNSDINPFKVGDILVGSSGYDAHISRFFSVIKTTASCVYLVELCQEQNWQQGGMDWTTKPTKETTGSSFRRNVKGGSYVRINSFTSAFKWSGEVCRNYNYH
jgi:hypothetical protein